MKWLPSLPWVEPRGAKGSPLPRSLGRGGPSPASGLARGPYTPLKTEPSPEVRLSAKLVCPPRIWGEGSGRHRAVSGSPCLPWDGAWRRTVGSAQPTPRRETQCKATLENFKYRSQIQSVRHHKSVKSNLGRVQHSNRLLSKQQPRERGHVRAAGRTPVRENQAAPGRRSAGPRVR